MKIKLIDFGVPEHQDVYKRQRVDGVKVGENPEGGEDVTLAGALMGLFRPCLLYTSTERSPLREMSAVMACVSLLKARHTKDIP